MKGINKKSPIKNIATPYYILQHTAASRTPGLSALDQCN